MQQVQQDLLKVVNDQRAQAKSVVLKIGQVKAENKQLRHIIKTTLSDQYLIKSLQQTQTQQQRLLKSICNNPEDVVTKNTLDMTIKSQFSRYDTKQQKLADQMASFISTTELKQKQFQEQVVQKI